jgi:Flp pilus assembly protein TadG
VTLFGRLLSFRRLIADLSGVSAVEFALILPVMLTLYLGGIQISDALSISRKVTHVASSLGDLVSQSKTISDTDMDNILDAAGGILAPYSASTLKMKIYGVKIDANLKATVCWGDGRNATAPSKGSTVTLPAAVTQKNTFVVVAEVHYDYKPSIGYALTGTFDLNDKFYLRPRLSDTVVRPPQATSC